MKKNLPLALALAAALSIAPLALAPANAYPTATTPIGFIYAKPLINTNGKPALRLGGTVMINGVILSNVVVAAKLRLPNGKVISLGKMLTRADGTFSHKVNYRAIAPGVYTVIITYKGKTVKLRVTV
jgi:hypothetical protein